MAKVSTYLNFKGQTEAAFNFYKKVFGTEFMGEIARFGSMPTMEGMPPIPDHVKNMVMHICLPILDGHLLMGTDAPDGMGFQVNPGNNVYIMLQPDTRKETDYYFNALAEGGKVEAPMQDMFWGDYYGSLKDKFGTQWMFACQEKAL